jgi:hypothetical protein
VRALWVLAFCALFAREGSAELRMTLSVERDDNLFATRYAARSGWANRLFVEVDEDLVARSWGRVYMRHQAGLKRLWQSEERGGLAGEVMANHLALGGALRWGENWTASWQTDGKLVNVQHLSREESYMRGGARVTGERRLGRATYIGGHYGVGRDDLRGFGAADVKTREIGVGARHGRGRLKSRVALTRRRLVVERDILAATGQRRDRMWEGQWGMRYFRRALFDLSYTFLRNSSNESAHRFRAHRLQALIAGGLVAKMDGQLYWTLQRRHYRGQGSLPPGGEADDEYAQNLLSAKVSRPLNEQCGLAIQWWHARNGSRQTAAFYRKNTFSLLFDMAL